MLQSRKIVVEGVSIYMACCMIKLVKGNRSIAVGDVAEQQLKEH